MSEGNSNIAKLLNQILTAIYGKDVRQSIHDAIQQCYSDVGDPALNEEAFKKVLDAAIADGSIGALTIGDKSITGAKIADSTITEDKLDPSILTGLKLSAEFNELTGELFLNTVDKIISKYPSSIESSKIYADNMRSDKTGEIESTDLLRSVTEWITLTEGVYINPKINDSDGISSNYGLAYFTIYEADKKTGEFIKSYRYFSNDLGYLAARNDRIYSFMAPTLNFSKRKLTKNVRNSGITPYSVNLKDILSDENTIVKTTYVTIKLTEYVPVSYYEKISKFKIRNFGNSKTLIAMTSLTTGIGWNSAALSKTSTDVNLLIDFNGLLQSGESIVDYIVNHNITIEIE